MSALAAPQTYVTPGSKKDQVIDLLKNGCKPSEVAAAVGCDISYVSQVLNPDTPEGQEIVLHRIAQLGAAAKLDGRYDDLESKLIDGLELKLQQGVHFLKVETILRAITAINGAKRRNVGGGIEGGVVNNIVNLIAPTILMKRYQVNQTNEVISVGDQPLIPMSAKAVMEKLKEITKNRIDGEDKEVNHGNLLTVGNVKQIKDESERIAAAEISLNSF